MGEIKMIELLNPLMTAVGWTVSVGFLLVLIDAALDDLYSRCQRRN